MFELLAAAGAGSVIGSVATSWLVRRALSGGRFEKVLGQELGKAFRAGFLTAADIVTIEGHDELAGKLRHAAAAVAANDNR